MFHHSVCGGAKLVLLLLKHFHLCDMHGLFSPIRNHWGAFFFFFFYLHCQHCVRRRRRRRFSPLIFTASWCGAANCVIVLVNMCARVFTSSWGASCFHVQMFQVRFSMLPWEPILSVLLSYRRKARMMEAYRNQTQSQTLKGCKPPPYPPPLENKISVYLTRLPTSYK